MLLRNFLSREFGAKFQKEVSLPLFLEVPEFPYNTVYDRSKKAPMPKPTGFVKPYAYQIELRPMTDRQIDIGPYLVPAFIPAVDLLQENCPTRPNFMLWWPISANPRPKTRHTTPTPQPRHSTFQKNRFFSNLWAHITLYELRNLARRSH